MNQIYKDIEIIVINDGSKDNSSSIIKSYQKKHPSIINYIEQSNIRVAKPRNNAIKIAKGEYIAFMDNDDYIDNDYFEMLMHVKNKLIEILKKCITHFLSGLIIVFQDIERIN